MNCKYYKDADPKAPIVKGPYCVLHWLGKRPTMCCAPDSSPCNFTKIDEMCRYSHNGKCTIEFFTDQACSGRGRCPLI